MMKVWKPRNGFLLPRCN